MMFRSDLGTLFDSFRLAYLEAVGTKLLRGHQLAAVDGLLLLRLRVHRCGDDSTRNQQQTDCNCTERGLDGFHCLLPCCLEQPGAKAASELLSRHQ
jgi:hypothetical protein